MKPYHNLYNNLNGNINAFKNLYDPADVPSPPGPPPELNNILLESGSFMLKEDGGELLLES